MARHDTGVAISTFLYSVKVMDWKKKSNFEVVQLKTRVKFKQLDDLKRQLLEELRDKVSEPLKVGYIEPGHGLRGKQRWLCSDDDVEKMYDWGEPEQAPHRRVCCEFYIYRTSCRKPLPACILRVIASCVNSNHKRTHHCNVND